MSVDEALDMSVDQFRWEVYTEMLDILDGELSESGFQSRFVRTEDRKLPRVNGVEATNDFPFLKHYVEFGDDGYSSAETVIHELAHNVLTQLSNEYNEFRSSFRRNEKVAQILEGFYVQESNYLESLGLKSEFLDNIDDVHDHYNGGTVELAEVLRNEKRNHFSTPEDIRKQEILRDN